MLHLEITKRTDKRLLKSMLNHYSKPKGFVGRSICYAVYWNNTYYGHIIAGSSTLHLPGRNEFFNNAHLNTIVNNIYYHIEKANGKYPCRNFSTKVIETWRKQVQLDWYSKYNDQVVGFESLVQLPRTGECYLKDNWSVVGVTKGYTCKRISGISTDSWTGKRVWNKTELMPKLVLCKLV